MSDDTRPDVGKPVAGAAADWAPATGVNLMINDVVRFYDRGTLRKPFVVERGDLDGGLAERVERDPDDYEVLRFRADLERERRDSTATDFSAFDGSGDELHLQKSLDGFTEVRILSSEDWAEPLGMVELRDRDRVRLAAWLVAPPVLRRCAYCTDLVEVVEFELVDGERGERGERLVAHPLEGGLEGKPWRCAGSGQPPADDQDLGPGGSAS